MEEHKGVFSKGINISGEQSMEKHHGLKAITTAYH